jgi:CBS domain-containing protein
VKVVTKMRLEALMSAPAVTVPPGARVKDVAALLVERGFNAVPVVGDRGELLGIVSEADLVELGAHRVPRAHLRPPESRERPVPRTAGEVMTTTVVTLPADTDAAVAARRMLDLGIKTIPVVTGGRIVGIVTRRDLLRALARGDREVGADLDHALAAIGIADDVCADVTGGVVTLRVFRPGPVDLTCRLAVAVANAVPGVVDVRVA